jgi:hypothetical protein
MGINEEFGSKMQYIHFCVSEKNAVKVWNLLGNALENFLRYLRYVFQKKFKTPPNDFMLCSMGGNYFLCIQL